MSALADLIDANCNHIVERFVDRLYETSASTSLKRSEVIDSLREFLTEISRGIREDEDAARQPETVPAPSATALEHGRQRFNLGYDVGAVIREYSALRDILFALIEQNSEDVSPRELRILSKYLISGIADAATQYAKERDQQLRQQASKHIAFLAHELRNPLASMRLAFSQLQRKGTLPPDDRASLALGRGMVKLNALIDEALIEVRLKAGAHLSLEEVVVRPLLDELVEDSGGEAEAKGVHIEVTSTAGNVRADVKFLRSALSNLVRNAVKFSRHGGLVQLRAREAEQRVVFEVEDECGGLAEGMIQKLFDPFVQAGKDRSGFGLGLAIAKQAVEAHQGTLRVHNVERRGCVFVLDLPREGPVLKE